MFETFRGIPLHPLLVHAVVVLLPLLVAAGLGYALIPRLRSRLDLAAGLLAVVAPVSTFLTRQSGLALRNRLISRGTLSADYVPLVNAHLGFANRTLIVSIVLGVLVLLLLGYQLRARRSGGSTGGLLWWILVGLTVVAGAVSLYYVYRTGDSGAHMVWQGR